MSVVQSMLFVPGNRPERFAKALASGADLVCIDLEDAVPDADKDAARQCALDVVSTDTRFAMRINGLTTAQGLADLLAIRQSSVQPSSLFLPKVESAHELVIARQVLANDDLLFVPLIETVKGLRCADEIAAEAQVPMMMFGGGDFSAELGVALAWEPLLCARSQFVMACAGAGVSAMDVPYIKLDDENGLRHECALAKELGFTAKAAIHPAQVTIIHDIFRPSPEALAEAYEARAAFAAAQGSAVRFRGKMLEGPIMRQYERIIAIGEKTHA
jgi:(S)-citramalyl-CoA lyase